VTKLHFRRIHKARLHPCRKLSLYYILPARWLLLALSLIAVFVVPTLAVLKIPMQGANALYDDPWSVRDLCTLLVYAFSFPVLVCPLSLIALFTDGVYSQCRRSPCSRSQCREPMPSTTTPGR